MIIDLRKTQEKKKIRFTRTRFTVLGLLLMFALVNTLALSAFEAHIINVVAEVVNDLPRITPDGRQFCDTGPIEITFTADAEDVVIIYTLDGTDPVCGPQPDLPINGMPYVGPFNITETTTIKARTCHNPRASAIMTWEFELEPEFCDDECEIEVGDFCTQTQGGWGQACNGNNVGCLRDAHWEDVVGDYLLVGAGFFMYFSEPEDVEAYLPNGGPPGMLNKFHYNSTTTEAGILGAQVTALKLNVIFSEAGVGLSGPNSNTALGYLTINSGPFAGMQVYYFLELAETVLGGDPIDLLFYGATISDVVDTAAAINENFVDCASDNGFLDNECCAGHKCCSGYEHPDWWSHWQAALILGGDNNKHLSSREEEFLNLLSEESCTECEECDEEECDEDEEDNEEEPSCAEASEGEGGKECNKNENEEKEGEKKEEEENDFGKKEEEIIKTILEIPGTDKEEDENEENNKETLGEE